MISQRPALLLYSTHAHTNTHTHTHTKAQTHTHTHTHTEPNTHTHTHTQTNTHTQTHTHTHTHHPLEVRSVVPSGRPSRIKSGSDSICPKINSEQRESVCERANERALLHEIPGTVLYRGTHGRQARALTHIYIRIHIHIHLHLHLHIQDIHIQS